MKRVLILVVSVAVHGWVDPAFRAVRDHFAANLADGRDLGAAVAAFVRGRPGGPLWGGIADDRTARPWERDTPCPVFSCTKAVTATAVLLAAREAGVDWTGRVTTWWPEYGAAGKEYTTLADLLSHRGGLPAFDRPVTVAEAADPAAMAAQLAGQPPIWPPGTVHGYHALTFGWLVGEFVRRRTGGTVGRFVRNRLNEELWLDVPQAVAARAARVGFPPVEERRWDDPGSVDAATVAEMARAYSDPGSLALRASTNPAGSPNRPEVLAGGWPGSGLVTTARALAGFYRDLTSGRLLPFEIVRAATAEQVRGRDAVLLLESAFGLGFMLPSENFALPDVARCTAFGHPGAGGAVGLGDLENQVAFAFTPNLRRDRLAGDRRAHDLIAQIYAAL